MAGALRYCCKCGKTIADTNFYTFKSGEKSDMCKACETMHINNYDPETFIWLLEKYDVPYIPQEWNVLRDKAYTKDPYKMNGMSVIGKYLSKMRIVQFKDYHYADSERLQAEYEEKARINGNTQEIIQEKIAAMKTAYENGEISEAQYKTYVGMTEQKAPDFSQNIINGAYPTNDHPFEKVELPDVSADLTQEDKIYLATKWGRLYSAEDWVALEEMYTEYSTSFSLHNADLIRGTIQLCKLDLKGNQALDSGDFDAYAKISRASDSLRKSLKFTEAQRKEDKETEFDTYGKIVAFAEKINDEEYIRPINLNIDRDIVDADIRNIKDFTKQLIEDDPTVYKMIEQYIKKREALEQQEKDQAEAEARGEEYVELTDEDFKAYNDEMERLKALDNEEVEED